MNYIFWIITFIVIAIFVITILDWFIIGIARPAKKKIYDKEFMLKNRNRLDFQRSTECSGYSFAYVLRSFGVEADGNDIYAKIDRKMRNGAVLPRTLRKVIQSYGLEAEYVRGSLETLKASLCAGKRVIVFIRTRLDKNWLHYVPVVGYDEEYIYIAESMSSLVNCKEEYYNRKISGQEFVKFWDTREFYMPFYRNTYLTVIERDEKES